MSFPKLLSCSFLFVASLALAIVGCNSSISSSTSVVNSQQDLFVSFQGNAVSFGSFQSVLPSQSSNPYTYFYGVGLK